MVEFRVLGSCSYYRRSVYSNAFLNALEINLRSFSVPGKGFSLKYTALLYQILALRGFDWGSEYHVSAHEPRQRNKPDANLQIMCVEIYCALPIMDAELRFPCEKTNDLQEPWRHTLDKFALQNLPLWQ